MKNRHSEDDASLDDEDFTSKTENFKSKIFIMKVLSLN